MKLKDAYSRTWEEVFKLLTHVHPNRFKDIPKHQTL